MKKNLSDLQWAVMEVLWNHRQCTAAEVLEKVHYEKELARTTVTTVLERLADDGVVKVAANGSPKQYMAALSRDDARRSMVGELVQRAFEGNPAAMVNHLLGEAGASEEELQQVKALLERHRRGNNND